VIITIIIISSSSSSSVDRASVEVETRCLQTARSGWVTSWRTTIPPRDVAGNSASPRCRGVDHDSTTVSWASATTDGGTDGQTDRLPVAGRRGHPCVCWERTAH